MKVLVIAEHNNQTLSASLLNCLTAAKLLSQDIDVLVAGAACADVADAAAKAEGVSKVLLADDASLEHQIAEAVCPIVVELAAQYDYILAASTTTGKNLLPRVAALLDVQAISDIISVEDANTFQRPVYAGNVIATVKSNDAKKVMTVRTTAFDAVAAEGNSAAVESVAVSAADISTKFESEELAKSDRPELSSASIVVSGGRGMKSGDNFPIIYSLADKLGAAVGASRAAVDAGYVPNDMQVGQTGKIVAPELYIAVGISGAIQHLAGMKDSKVIVAINSDEEAPIFQVADYGLVADLFDAVPKLEAQL
jgi:electron transfer flavoprotein alpha subunit